MQYSIRVYLIKSTKEVVFWVVCVCLTLQITYKIRDRFWWLFSENNDKGIDDCLDPGIFKYIFLSFL